jgi:uncharacterized cupredoxin-like copper-binding protein
VQRRIALGIATSALVALASVAPAGAVDADTTRFCDLNFQISQHFNNEPDEDASEKRVQAFTKRANLLLTRAQAAAPDAIATQVDTAATALKDDLQTAFEDPAVGDAVGDIDQWALDNCGYPLIEVTLVDYAFEGIPASVATGKTAFSLTNTGTEAHEMAIARIKTDTPVDVLLESERRAEREVQFVGRGFAEPGEVGSALVDFKKPGRYVAVCFVPQGTTVDAEGDGPPHFTQGMVTEFEVDAA